jgi:hypothetical protein
MKSAILNMSEGLAPDGCLTLKERTMTAQTVPDMLAIFPSKKGYELRDASKVSPHYARVPSSNPLFVARKLYEVVTGVKEQIHPYSFYAPKVDNEGRFILVRDAAGNIFIDDKGKTVKEQVDLARAIREVEDGKRTAVVARGNFGTFKVNMYPANETATKKGAAQYDAVAQYFLKQYEAAQKKK